MMGGYRTTVKSRRRHKISSFMEECKPYCMKYSPCSSSSTSFASSSTPCCSPAPLPSSSPSPWHFASSSSPSSAAAHLDSLKRSDEYQSDIEFDEMKNEESDRMTETRNQFKTAVSNQRCRLLPPYWIILIALLSLMPQLSEAFRELRCGSIDIRNSPYGYLSKQLNVGDPDGLYNYTNISQVNCTVVEGSFLMTFITSNDANKPYEQWQYPRFPHLREITGSLLVFQVQGLKSLSWILPNLRVIGGQRLIQHYALIVFRNDELENLGLEHLSVIRTGGVRITENKRLCHFKTIDWRKMIMTKVNDVILDDSAEASVTETGQLCPNEPCVDDEFQSICKHLHVGDSVVQSCWNATTCQKECKYDRIGDKQGPGCDPYGNKCDDQCLGGCEVANSARDCYACANYHYQGRCVPECGPNLYVLLGRRCVSKEKCLSLNPVLMKTEVQIKASQGLCSDHCPEKFEEDPTNPHECVPCDGECQITCVGNYSIDTFARAMEVKRCHIINGSLTLEIKGAMDTGAAAELGEAFAKIHTITGYLSIIRSPNFLNLYMFKSLKRIEGNYLSMGKYSLSVFENTNLKKLFNTENRLIIGKGLLQFHNNRMLCFRQIQQLMEKLEREKEMNELDQSVSSNGDKAICEDSTFELTVQQVDASFIAIQWPAFNSSDVDHRKFLGYEIYYKEVEKVNYNMSIDDDRSACSDTWHSMFLEKSQNHDTTPFQEQVLSLEQSIKPHTTYAFYVSTHLVHHTGARNAVSKIAFATTLFAVPDPPTVTVHRVDSDQIELHFDPPGRPNGVITHYMIHWREIEANMTFLCSHFCDEDGRSIMSSSPTLYPDESTSGKLFTTTTTTAPSITAFMGGKGSADTCSSISGCCQCSAPVSVEKTEDDTNFENSLHDTVFVQSCDIDYDPVRCAYWEPEHEEIGPEENPEDVTAARIRRTPEAWERRRVDILKTAHSIRNSYQDVEYVTAILMKRRRRAITPGDEDKNSEVTDDKEKNRIRISKKNKNDTELDPTKTKAVLNEKRFADGGLKSQNVTAKKSGTNIFTITGLKHYTQYSITVSACQDITAKYNYCSVPSKAAKMKRTKPLPDVGVVPNKTIKAEFVNSTSVVRVTFDPPEKSNGGIRGYLVNFRKADNNETVYSKCLAANAANWTAKYDNYTTKELANGRYRIEVIAYSLHTHQSTFSEKILVVYTPGFWTVGRIFIVAMSLLLILVIAALITYYTIKKYYGKRVQEMADLMSTNPEYVIEQVYRADDWELRREDLEVLEEIGKGSFGKVYRGMGNNVLSKCGKVFGECAVKMVLDDVNPAEKLHFLMEANVMKKFDTPFIISLMGVVSTGQPTLVAMELMSNGNLRDYLRSRRPGAEENINNREAPSKQQYHEWASQIADGMAYLESIKFCHRDLAARNIMVRSDEVVKIGDFGMARDLYYHDYYKPTGKRLMPVRWMAPESLKDGKFDAKSDCWSYGVVLYEMITLGQQPYQGLGNDEVLNYTGMSRKVLDRPAECPDYWYTVMRMCWRYHPRDRPSFAQLVQLLSPHATEEFRATSFVCNSNMDIEEICEEELNGEGEDKFDEDAKLEHADMEHLIDPNDDRLRLDSIAMKEFRPCSSMSSSSRSSLIASKDSGKGSAKSLSHAAGTSTSSKASGDRPRSLDRDSAGYHPLVNSVEATNENFEEGDYVDHEAGRERKESIPSTSSSTGQLPNSMSSNSNTLVEDENGYCLSNRNGTMDFPAFGEGERLTSARRSRSSRGSR